MKLVLGMKSTATHLQSNNGLVPTRQLAITIVEMEWSSSLTDKSVAMPLNDFFFIYCAQYAWYGHFFGVHIEFRGI